MGLPRAEFKLREARFFLGMMQQEVLRTARSESEDFRFLLSAFLAASDSVRDIGDEDDSHFYPFRVKWKANLVAADHGLVTFMEEQRNSEIHEKQGAALAREEHSIDARQVPSITVMSPPLAAIVADAQARGVAINPDEFIPKLIRFDWVFKGLGPQVESDVVVACDRYLGLLESLVQGFDGRSTGAQS